MKKFQLILMILGGIIILGFVLGLLTRADIECTERGCGCVQDGEIPCNSCTSSDNIFSLGVINVIKECEAVEIVLCQNGRFETIRHDVISDRCRFIIG